MSESLPFWFRRRFNLPPTDPRFLDATLDAMAAEYWAWRYAESDVSEEEAFDDDFDAGQVLADLESQIDDWEPI